MAQQTGSTTEPAVRPIRRLVTGVDSAGRSIFLSDGPTPHVTGLEGIPNFGITEIWKTLVTPADLRDPSDQITTVQPGPPPGGTIFRIVEFAPDAGWVGRTDMKDAVAAIGEAGAQALAQSDASRHPMMHTTRTVDYAIVVSGEIWAVLDAEERKMTAGDVLVQRGTSHAWANRSNAPALVAFVLIDAAR